jgi:hypothetical protein
MARSATLLSAAAALLLSSSSSASASSAATGTLTGVFRDPNGGPCMLIAIDIATGVNTTIGTTTVCDTATGGLFPSYSALDLATDPSNPRLLIAIQTVPILYAVDLKTAKATPVVAMPAYNESDFLLGLSLSGTDLYLTTQTSVYSASTSGAGKLKDIGVPANFPQYAQVAANPSGGSNGMPLIFVADENSKTMWVVDTGKPTVNPVPTVNTGVNGPIAAHWDPSTSSIIEIASYTLYSTTAAGKTTRLGSVPDGPGYPRVSGISPDGGLTYVMDFANVFTMSTTTGQVGKSWPFVGGPRVVGFPVWTA